MAQIRVILIMSLQFFPPCAFCYIFNYYFRIYSDLLKSKIQQLDDNHKPPVLAREGFPLASEWGLWVRLFNCKDRPVLCPGPKAWRDEGPSPGLYPNSSINF